MVELWVVVGPWVIVDGYYSANYWGSWLSGLAALVDSRDIGEIGTKPHRDRI